MKPSRGDTRRTLWIVGYGGWPTSVRAEAMVAALRECRVTRLVDVRISPCASDLKPGRYGPKPWNLQQGSAGIAGLLDAAGIAYEWMVELGNPQRHDPEMRILRAHLADAEGGWPVHRGLERLTAIVRRPTEVVALLCACADYRSCHRTVVARALATCMSDEAPIIRDVRRGAVVET